MAFEFLRELLEAGQTHPLINNPEFNALAKAAPQFADKLVTAWNGDVQELARTGKKDDLLFPKMIAKISKYVPELPITPQVQKVVNDLIRLHAASFSGGTQGVGSDPSTWQHKPGASHWAVESTENVSAKYKILQEEYEDLSSK